MSMRPAHRRSTLLFFLVASLGASAWTYWRQGRGDVVAVGAVVDARRQARFPERSSAPEASSLLNLRPMSSADQGDIAGSDPFAVKSWQGMAPPAPPPPPPAPPPVPTAPVLPFKYMGRQEDPAAAAATVFYLSRGRDAYAVRVGDKLDSEYQLDGIDNGFLQFTYLPLSTKQTLSTGVAP